MLDFGTLTIENLEGQAYFQIIFLIIFILTTILFVLAVLICALNSDAPNLIFVTTLEFALIFAGRSHLKSEPQKISVQIKPTVENIEDLVDGEAVIKEKNNYYYVDVLTRKEIKQLQKASNLNKKVTQDFEDLLDSYSVKVKDASKEVKGAENSVSPPAPPSSDGKCTCGQEIQ